MSAHIITMCLPMGLLNGWEYIAAVLDWAKVVFKCLCRHDTVGTLEFV